MLKKLILFAFILILFVPALGFSDPAEPETTQELYSLFENFRNSYDKIKDYSAKFSKQEFMKGKWEKEVIDFYFKKPFKVKMKWLQGSDKGQQVVFIEGKNDNKVLVKLGGLIGIVIPTLHLDPNGDLAKDDAGHTIREAGLGYMMEELLKVTEGAEKKGDLELKLIEKKKNLDGDGNVLVIERDLPGGQGYPTQKLIIYVDEKLGIPVGVDRYNDKGELFGKYFYEDLKTNQGLPDKDFKL